MGRAAERATTAARDVRRKHARRDPRFATLGPDRDEGAQADEGELHAIYLGPRHWRRGIGSGLLSVALTHLRDLGFVTATLWVLAGNDRAISFYRRTGWRPDGTTRTDVGPAGVPLPEIRFRRDLRD